MATVKPTSKTFEAFEKALLDSEYGFDADDVAQIEEGEAEHGLVTNWSRAIFDEVLGVLKGRAAYEVVRRVKSGASDAREQRTGAVPNRAPYLAYNADGAAVDYDPRDPSQFYTDPDTGEMYRWDGKGERHRTVQVEHRRFGDTLLPVEDAALAAIESGFDWFHHGFAVWYRGQKALADPTQDVRDKVRVAMLLRDRTSDGSNPFASSRITPAMAG